MQTRVKAYMKQLHMTEPGDRVLVGLSGGADSVCLLLLLHCLQQELEIRVSAVHVEHGIRGEESMEDAMFARRLCEQLEIPFHICHVNAVAEAADTHRSLEEAARVLRYECYRKICQEEQIQVVALAHHADDNAETMLFHLSRGTGVRGLSGIGPVRTDQNGNRIIRPLLCVTRTEIEEWLQKQQQEYCIDSTNKDTAYARNRIRACVLPELSRINAQAVQHMSRTADMLREMADYVEEMAHMEGQMCVCSQEPLTLDITGLQAMRPLLRETFLLEQMSIVAGSRKDLTTHHVQMVCRLLEQETGRSAALPYGLQAQREYEHLILTKTQHDVPTVVVCDEVQIPGITEVCSDLYIEETTQNDRELSWRLETKVFPYTGQVAEIPGNQYTKWFDYDKIKDTVQIRARRQGDYLQLDGSGRHKKLNRYFIDEKIPAGRRDRVALIADGSHIMWIPGGRISEGYKIDAGTTRVLQMKLIRNEDTRRISD